jgi:DNA polymerase
VTDAHATARPFLPPRVVYPALVRAAEICTGCDLHHLGTRTVFGEGPTPARVMLVGEQPGDLEDQEGHPFVGPAGRVLDRALEEANLPRDEVYVTNAVKHFRWEGTRGTRRLHRRPSMRHLTACHPWLEAELAVVRPEVVVCLGATAARAILGRDVRIGDVRGSLLEAQDFDPLVAVTVHPSSLLRAEDPDRERERQRFVRDLAAVRTAIDTGASRRTG